MTLLLSLLSLLSLLAHPALSLRATGNTTLDFSDTTIDPVTGRAHNHGTIFVLDGPLDSNGSSDGNVYNDIADLPSTFVSTDVGVPPGPMGEQRQSGIDIARVFLQYVDVADALYIGVDCFGICGDLDGDGFPGFSMSGVDPPDYQGLESIIFAIDFDGDVEEAYEGLTSLEAQQLPLNTVPWDLLVGVPSQQPESSPDFLCDSSLSLTSCLHVYEYDLDASASRQTLSGRAKAILTLSGSPWPMSNIAGGSPSASKPDLEWRINQVSQLRDLFVPPTGNETVHPADSWTVVFAGYSGYDDISSTGQDLFPQAKAVSITFPCLTFDQCDVCLGDSTTCQDCAGVPNGPTEYDECDVCGGDSSTCADCFGIPNGVSELDACGVCEGGNATCSDCAGVVFGTLEFDACGVCGGDNECLDCVGILDVCGVCNGDNATCTDCTGVIGGNVTVDQCGVCGGDGLSCVDCAGTVGGDLLYDQCGVCGGDTSSCSDCSGVLGGVLEYDACGICGGDNSSCTDCAGEVNGEAEVYECYWYLFLLPLLLCCCCFFAVLAAKRQRRKPKVERAVLHHKRKPAAHNMAIGHRRRSGMHEADSDSDTELGDFTAGSYGSHGSRHSKPRRFGSELGRFDESDSESELGDPHGHRGRDSSHSSDSELGDGRPAPPRSNRLRPPPPPVPVARSSGSRRGQRPSPPPARPARPSTTRRGATPSPPASGSRSGSRAVRR
jgi:hypothetical protein